MSFTLKEVVLLWLNQRRSKYILAKASFSFIIYHNAVNGGLLKYLIKGKRPSYLVCTKNIAQLLTKGV